MTVVVEPARLALTSTPSMAPSVGELTMPVNAADEDSADVRLMTAVRVATAIVVAATKRFFATQRVRAAGKCAPRVTSLFQASIMRRIPNPESESRSESRIPELPPNADKGPPKWHDEQEQEKLDDGQGKSHPKHILLV